MRSVSQFFVFIGGMSLLVGCQPVGTEGSGAGTCSYDRVFGTWKKVDGYSPSRSDETLEYDFHVLIVEPSVSRICEADIVNYGNVGTFFKADYSHDIDNKELELTYTLAPQGTQFSNGDSQRVSYTTGCSGSTPTLALSWGDGSRVRYELQASSGSSCDPQ